MAANDAQAAAGPSSIQRVIVSYAAPPNVISSAKWQQVRAALKAQLPLRNIHWKPASRNSLRTIQELDVDFVPLETVRDEHTQIPGTLLEKPLLNIYVVVAPNNDVESYRTTVKKQIRDWYSLVTAKRHQEWLILHIVRPDQRPQGGNFFQLSSVFEKIRTDFNTEKKERCVQVAWSPETDTPTAWAEFFNKIKDGLLLAFDSAVSQREEEVRRSEGQRQMPGWNFCTFFILKESLASSFEGVTLYEDAYAQYEELEALFYHAVKEQNLSWFGNLINPASGDDSSSLLSTSKKAYRDLILANTISIFDFRIYVLSRQCELLARQSRLIEISKKAEAFLGAFGRRLQEIEKTLPRFFIESWIYSSALSVIEYCDKMASELTGPKLDSFNAAKGELLELARNQLDVIGVTAGHLPSKLPFSVVYPKSRPTSQSITTPISESGSEITNAAILAAIDNADSFYELYVQTTNRAISMYTKAGRKKFALRLHGSLAALDLHRCRFEAALTTFNSLPAHYASHSWTSLEAYMLSRALDTHTSAGQEKNTEWIHILLSFLKTYVDSFGLELLIHEEDKIAYITGLVEDLRLAAGKLEADLPYDDHPAVSITLSKDAKLAENRDGCFLEATVRNRLPCAIRADEIIATIVGRDSDRYKFTSSTQELPPGKTQLSLFCPVGDIVLLPFLCRLCSINFKAAVLGTYILETTEVHVSRLCFRWTHRTPSGKPPSQRKPVLVRIPKDSLALDIHLKQPRHIELGEPSMLLVEVLSGRNDVLEASVKVASSGVAFRLQEAYFSGDKERSKPVEIIDNAIMLRNVPKDTIVAILVPHSDTSAFQAMVSTEVTYRTVSEPDLPRMISTIRVVLTALPISVNVEDFFRGTRLFSKFTISTTSHQHVRISDAELTAEDDLEGVKIVSCATKNRGVVNVTPTQPAHFLFYIDSAHGPVREPLTLMIRYRMLREEVESVLESAVMEVLGESPLPRRRTTLMNKMIEALEYDSAWVELYGITGELKPSVAALRGDEEGEQGKLLLEVKEILSQHKHPDTRQGRWREIKIPVDVPYMNIIAAARLHISATPFGDAASIQGPLPLYAGQPISAVLTIHTSFHWGSSAGDKDPRYMLRYDLEEMIRDWLVSGPKRGDFAAMNDTTHTVPITLIALHHGEISLPKIVVTALPMAGQVTMGSMAIPSIETYQVHGAEKVLVLPRGGRSTFVIGMGPG